MATRDTLVLSPIDGAQESGTFAGPTRIESCVPGVPGTIPVLPCRFKFDGGTSVASKGLTAQKRVTTLNLLADPSVWVDQGPGSYPTFERRDAARHCCYTTTSLLPSLPHTKWGGNGFGGGEIHVEMPNSGSQLSKRSNHGAILHFIISL